jgi:hypothetical protein
MRRGGIFMENYGPAIFLTLAGFAGICVAAVTGGIIPLILGGIGIITGCAWILYIRQKN